MSDTSPARSKWQRRLPLIASVLAIADRLAADRGASAFILAVVAPKPALESGMQSGMPQEGELDPRL